MGFSQALSGLNAAASSLDVQGNNIANSQTVGFKSSSAQFADVFANSKIGLGTRMSAVLQDFGEGNLESTGRALDLGISGQGFFRFMQNDQVVYSRNGQLSMTADGYLQNAQGARIMGFGAVGGEVQAGGQPEVLQVGTAELEAKATESVSMVANLDSRVTDNELNEVDIGGTKVPYHFSSNFTAYDSLGNPKNTTVYFQKTGAGSWSTTATVDGEMAGATTLNFDSNGQITNDPATIEVDLALANGANGLDFDIDVSDFTQFGNTSRTTDLQQDGYTSGAFVGISIEADGTIMSNFSNEQSAAVGQIAMTNFRNPEGLKAEGGNAWSATQASGQELVGAPGTGLLGSIESGAIESSNVDMARELVDMIVTQRAYQANSQTIKTQDEVLQTAINLR
ncbi:MULTISPECIES: flagellar hook protein FlgE [unclassified Halomonas]|uniref:flagellar hook protein FlgE n=1 Tax=unclassified Halomonas TaxID=2609666 RepID=UPI0028879546|nr:MULTISPECIES: flagellar hook protein FlgE [unclassified Halomonas]MDT0500519.1 flagellar hook protein FlgE [Halomonas sp. PAR7]MDT0511585.1 flagellar hook protein FlgE [Halomonas sp. LES1]MDT0590127.1 flagellar hook protein FlgE [Halomonas sp. PAR8]